MRLLSARIGSPRPCSTSHLKESAMNQARSSSCRWPRGQHPQGVHYGLVRMAELGRRVRVQGDPGHRGPTSPYTWKPGAAPATIRVARAAIAKVHQVSGLADPTADSLCRDVLRRIGREGRHRGRGQVAGIGWAQAEAAASLADDGSGSLQGLRDAAIILVMSDTLARISEVAALQCKDVESYTTDEGGSVHIRASKADQFGEGSTRYIGPATLTAIDRYLQAADHATGPLFRRVLDWHQGRGCFAVRLDGEAATYYPQEVVERLLRLVR